MIKHFSLDNAQPESIHSLINSADFSSSYKVASATLIQVYSSQTENHSLATTLALLSGSFPDAIIVGATTVGEIFEGKLETNKTVVGISLFESTKLTAISKSVELGDEFKVGQLLGKEIRREYPNTKGVLLLATPLSIAGADLLNGLQSTAPKYPLFGGGAGDYDSLNKSSVFSSTQLMPKGVVAVLFEGPDIEIESETYLGWRSLSRPMRITRCEGMELKTIDDRPAIEVYRKYLDISDDDAFFMNALEFPILIERHGRLLARVPVAVSEDGGLVFVADINEGETFRLGYGDPGLIVEDAKEVLDTIKHFSPEVVFLYSCGCRRFLMQEDVELETLPMQAIAPTFGFYTFGEFFADKGKLPLLNSTLVTVSLKEATKSEQQIEEPNPNQHLESKQESVLDEFDPYAHKHARIVSRLVKFISASTRELELANEAKSQFLANTSHELRTPLTAISGYAEAMLAGDISPSEQTNALEIIHTQSQHLLSLINDILDLSKIEAQELNVTVTQFNLSDLILELSSLFNYQAQNKGINFSIVNSEAMPEVIESDPERLQQILVNLLSNAIKFTGQGQVSMKLHYEPNREELQIDIIDSGIGLSEHQMEQIFSPFSQVLSDQTKHQRGTGLGLSISRQLAKLLGGDIQVTSLLGKGSTFSLTIKAPAVETREQKQHSVSCNMDILPNQNNHSVLVAEDSVENGKLFKLLLENAGYRVDLVENGALAVEQSMSNHYDLILLDIQMPVMGGSQALELIRYSGIECPIIALTANAMTNEVSNYLQQGFTACIAKPVQKASFLCQISEHISVKAKETEVIEIDPKTLKSIKESAINTIRLDGEHLSLLCKTNDLTALRKLAHKLKGLSAQFEFKELSGQFSKLEKIDSINSCHELVTEIQALISELPTKQGS